MEIAPAAQIFAFGLFSLIAIGGALGMTTTMSMFRSGIFLMASFIGVAGLFILLQADLLALLQVMMYIGGMLVMILFMVLFSGDPGGEMMASMMQLPPIEKFFSMGLAHQKDHGTGQDDDGEEHGGDGEHEGHGGHGGGHGDMSMFTPIKKPAAVLAIAVGVLLVGLVVLRPAWPVVDQTPNQNSPQQIGQMLMNKYMIAFEGAALLILLSIFGAVWAARPGSYPDAEDRQQIQAAVDATPADIDDDAPEPTSSALRPGAGTSEGLSAT